MVFSFNLVPAGAAGQRSLFHQAGGTQELRSVRTIRKALSRQRVLDCQGTDAVYKSPTPDTRM